MKRTFIKTLTVLITIAFVGLILIQLYWINNSIRLREAEFNYNVSRSLDRVVNKLAESEVWNSIIESPTAPEEEGLNPEGQHTPTLLSDSVFPVNSLNQVETDHLNNELRARDEAILTQSGLMEDVQNGVLSIDILQSIADQLDPAYLDSLLRSEFSQKGITASYAFGVFSWNDHPEILETTCEGYLNDLIETGFQSQLYAGASPEDAYYLRVFFPHQKRYLLQTMWVMLSISAVLMLSIMFAFLYTITTIFRQKKISDIKNDFINNMTHELKTPISTIGLACEALSDPSMRSSEQQLKTFVGMINEENKRLGVLVENVLRSAVLDRGEIKVNRDQVNMHDVIATVVRNLAIQVKKKGGSIKTEFKAFNPIVHGDRIHLTNLVYNMVDNAIKYSNAGLEVLIQTEDTPNGILMRFVDNGIGISKENQKKIFDKLFRVPTGNVHDVRGFGLGLSYVKAIVEKHHGRIHVESELNKGSTFTIELPADHEHQD